MKSRFWPILFMLASVLALAADEAPPAELLQNLDFYQNMNMVQDQQFITMATRTFDDAQKAASSSPPAVDSSTIHGSEKAYVSK